MKNGLLRRAVWLLTPLMLCSTLGCGTDEQDNEIQRTFTALDEVTRTVGEVGKPLKDAVTNLKPGEQITALDAKGQPNPNLKKAFEAAEKLRKEGENLPRFKELTDRLETRTTAEHRKELAARYQTRLRDRLKTLIGEENKLQQELNTAEARADEAARAEIDRIRTKLREAREAFEVLTKER
ncbi:MAG: hypothetical protein IT429_10195 [Gemmataceae bacterium]|nr:hypothetical protein [Gemmataceae bacterium]